MQSATAPEWAVALYDYVPQESGDLALKVNDIVQVIAREEISGWWTGSVDDRYVRVMHSGMTNKIESFCIQYIETSIWTGNICQEIQSPRSLITNWCAVALHIFCVHGVRSIHP
jgi:hypothetical protein